METEKLPEVWLECFNEESAQKIIDFCNAVPPERKGRNSARREGSFVTITYTNKMWPYDIAEMAEAENLASDDRTAEVYGCL